MGTLVGEMVRSLSELQLGFKGELTMSEAMENLMNSLYLEKIPPWWAKLGFASLRPHEIVAERVSDVGKDEAAVREFFGGCGGILSVRLAHYHDTGRCRGYGSSRPALGLHGLDGGRGRYRRRPARRPWRARCRRGGTPEWPDTLARSGGDGPRSVCDA